jgi:hypothetical protein
MPSSANDRVDRDRAARTDDLARRLRELEQFRANIERLRREREGALAEFRALTRKDEGPPLPPAAVAQEPARRTPLGEPDGGPPAPPPEAQRGSAEAAEPDVPLDGPPNTARGEGTPSEPSPEPTEAPVIDQWTHDGACGTGELRQARAAPGRTLLVGLLGAAALVAVSLALWGPWKQERVGQPESSLTPAGDRAASPREASSPPTTARPSDAPAGEQAPAAASPRRLAVRLVASRTVWIGAVADGRPSLNRTVEAGQSLTVEADASVTLRIGDAGAVRLSVNGRDRGLAGRDGQVLTARFDANRP